MANPIETFGDVVRKSKQHAPLHGYRRPIQLICTGSERHARAVDAAGRNSTQATRLTLMLCASFSTWARSYSIGMPSHTPDVTEGFGKPHCHRGRDATLAVYQIVQGLPASPLAAWLLPLQLIPTVQCTLGDNASRMERIFQRMT
jgi:hypothetical protein